MDHFRWVQLGVWFLPEVAVKFRDNLSGIFFSSL